MAAKEPKIYTQLARIARRSGFRLRGGGCSLWLGPDHLLMVEESNFTEDYKRFYLKDIKAIIVRKTGNWKVSSWILGGTAFLIAVLFALGAASANNGAEKTGILIWGACVTGFFLLLLLIHLLQGPSCICHIRTSVQQEEVGAINNLKKARKVFEKIRAAVEGVQGAMTEADYDEIAELASKYRSIPADAIRAERPRAEAPAESDTAP